MDLFHVCCVSLFSILFNHLSFTFRLKTHTHTRIFVNQVLLIALSESNTRTLERMKYLDNNKNEKHLEYVILIHSSNGDGELVHIEL